MENKIGIITFHASHNCGSMLQAYALQYILEKKYQQNVEIINFSNKGQQNLYACLPKPDNLKRLIKDAIYLTNIINIKRQQREYNDFFKYFNLTKEKYQHTEELSVLDLRYNKLISGSDQVWNIKCSDADPAYFLSFSNLENKYAYAVSFGANNVFSFDDKVNEYTEYCNKYKKISVRENNAKKWVDYSLKTDVPLCLDPTLLLSKEDWEESFNLKERIINGKYIFCYTFGLNRKVNRFLKFISQKYNLPVYIIDPKEWSLKLCWMNRIKLAKRYGPISFLNLLKYSEMVITTSFHGTVFSYIFKKTFWYIDNEKNSLDDRATSLLNQLKLLDRFKSINILKEINLLESINFQKSDESIFALKNKSLKFIEEIIND